MCLRPQGKKTERPKTQIFRVYRTKVASQVNKKEDHLLNEESAEEAQVGNG